MKKKGEERRKEKGNCDIKEATDNMEWLMVNG